MSHNIETKLGIHGLPLLTPLLNDSCLATQDSMTLNLYAASKSRSSGHRLNKNYCYNNKDHCKDNSMLTDGLRRSAIKDNNVKSSSIAATEQGLDMHRDRTRGGQREQKRNTPGFKVFRKVHFSQT